ncbi:hypothetical protein [Georgenia muralis]|uniref:Septum formation initiator n=1 Tax=Georgenia muralis TaxID=154117 RepID=A0A3N4ZKY5_9MICO|nr:hypothetical protein [Georgenia muralis]RPF26342.1 hypothetical protein EDD32_0780 [Georgenia muralis]
MDGTGGAGRRGGNAGGTGRVGGAVMVLAWVLAVALVGLVAWWAVAAVVDPGEGRASVLSPVEVESARAAQEAAAPDPTVGPTPSPTSEPTADPTIEPTEPPTTTGEVARTWDVTGGQVGVVCRGAALELLYATPVEGWTVELGDDDDDLEVEFRTGGSETKLQAVCVDGVPTASVEDDTDED